MGDKYLKKIDLVRAFKSYNLAKAFLPGEAQEKLNLIPQWIQSSESNRPTHHSYGEGYHRAIAKEKVNEASKYFKPSSRKLSITGPFFPKDIHPPQPSVSSLDTLIPQKSSYTFNDAPDTNSVVTIYIDADDEARVVLRDEINKVINQFNKSSISMEAVQELVILAKTPDRDIFLLVITQMLKVLKEKPMLASTVLQGMAVAINSWPDEIDMDNKQGIYLQILRPLKQYLLETIQTQQNENQLIPLLHALSALLNAMVRKNVSAIDRETIFNPLMSSLGGLKSHDDTTVVFLAMYAKQALVYIGNNESLTMSIFRHAGLAILMAGDIAGGISGTDPSKFVSAYNNLTAFCNFSVQAKWYPGLAYADCTLELQNWSAFEAFVLQSKLNSNEYFLQGICLRLEQIGVTQRNEVRLGAIAFLHALIPGSKKLIQETAQAALKRLGAISSSGRNAMIASPQISRTTSDQPISQIYQGCLPPVWDPVWHTTTGNTLLKEVQRKEQANVKIDGLAYQMGLINTTMTKVFENTSIPSCPDDVHDALQSYYKPLLFIRRVSGERLPLESCYINLAIVEAPGQREKDREDLKAQAVTFQRMPSHERTGRTNMASSIPMEELFNKQKLQNGSNDVPKKILIHGRAGIGKTTLCKKLVHLLLSGQWRGRFDSVLWLPLRELKSFKSRNLTDLFSEKYFSQYSDVKKLALARALFTEVENDKILFILDGLDELQTDGDPALDSLLSQLLSQQHIVITSRPSGVDKSVLPTIDLELETVGFNPQNVKDYLEKVIPAAADEVEGFIQRTPVIQGLVNIPVQLDAICFSWGSLLKEHNDITMTELYQAMVRKLWCKDAIRLGKTSSGRIISENQINKLSPRKIDELMDIEIEYLGYLAFNGLKDSHQIIFNEEALAKAVEDLDDNRQKKNRKPTPFLLLDDLKQTSFLHSPDADLKTVVNNLEGSWHFLHLTFQEYFAATFLARHLQKKLKQGVSSPVLMMTPEEAKEFVLKYKYNPQFEIVWWMVAGQLREETLMSFFDLLQVEPLDLIGGYHHHLLAACLKESRNQLDNKRVQELEIQLEKWLHFEMMSTYESSNSRSSLGVMSYLPERLVLRINTKHSSALQQYILRTLGNRVSLTQSTIKVLVDSLQDDDMLVRGLAADALKKQSTLSESALQALLGALKEEDYYMRSPATFALRKQTKMPELAVQALIGTLQDKDGDVRRSAAYLLGKQLTLPMSAFQPLIGALQDKDEDVRSSAASTLGEQLTLPEPAALALIRALQDKVEYVRHSVVISLGKQSKLPKSAILALISALQDKIDYIRRSAADVFGAQSTLSESVLQALIGAMQDKSLDVRSAAASALGKQLALPEPAFLALIAVLQGNDDYVRNSAADALGKQSTLPEAALQALIGAMQDKSLNVRSSAASALGKKSTLPEPVLLALVSVLRDKDEHIRRSAADVLEEQSTLPESSLLALISALQDKSLDVRSSAASVLGKQLSLPESALLALIGVSQEKENNVRWSAADILGQLELPEPALLGFIGALQEKNEDVRDSAAYILGKQSTLPQSSILALISALQSDSRNARDAATDVLGKQSTLPGSALQALIGALRNKSKYIRRSAVNVFGTQSTLSESVLQALIGALQDESLDVRSGATSALRKQLTLPEPALLALTAALRDKDCDIRKSAADVLGKQSTLPEAALQVLIGALQDVNWGVRRAAASALGYQSILPESSLLAVISALQEKEKDVRDTAVYVLGKQSTLSESSILALIGALQCASWGARSAAVDVLGKQSALPESALLALTSALQDKNEYIRRSAASVLGDQSGLPDITFEALISSLQDQSLDVRSTAAFALGKQSTLPESVLLTVICELQEGDEDVRHSAASVLGNQSPSPESALHALISALQDENRSIRSLAADILAKQLVLPESTILALIGVLQRRDDGVSNSAAVILGKQSKLPEAALQALIDAIQDGSSSLRSSVVNALGNQSTLPEAAFQVLLNALQDENQEVKSIAASALGKHSTLSESALLALIGALQDKEQNIRSKAASALGKQSTLSESALLALIGALQDKEQNVRSKAASALGKQSTLPESALLALIGALQHKMELTRTSAAGVLGKQLTLPELALLALIKLLHHKMEYVRSSAAALLGNQLKLPEKALLALIDVLQENIEYVKSSTAGVLGNQLPPLESALQSLTGALLEEDKDILVVAVKVLEQDAKQTFMKIPNLSPSKIKKLHKSFLIQYGGQYSASLWVHEHQIFFHTAQGPGEIKGLSENELKKLVEAFGQAGAGS
ncbi:hypothetical protein BGX27_008796, partial [Mortierella sp. AM989]